MGHGRPESMTIGHCMGLTAAAVIWLGGKPSPGYLAKVGPAPLRFKAPAKGPEATVALPPLVMTDPPPPPPEEYGPPPPTNAPVAVVETVAPPEPAPVQTVALPPVLSPQLLIPFFNRSGTNQDVGVVVPYQFSPPAATIPAPPSRAVYSTK